MNVKIESVQHTGRAQQNACTFALSLRNQDLAYILDDFLVPCGSKRDSVEKKNSVVCISLASVIGKEIHTPWAKMQLPARRQTLSHEHPQVHQRISG